MSKIALFKELTHHRALAEKRSMMHGRNKSARIILGISVAFIILYLLMISILLALSVDSHHIDQSASFIVGIFPFILACDFFVRFVAQQTPSQLVKPYLLMPIQKQLCIDTFVARSLINWSNLIWLILIVPYTFITMIARLYFLEAVAVIFFYWVLILFSSQLYLICRTLINKNMLAWILPAVFFALLFLPFCLKGHFDFDQFKTFYGYLGETLIHGNVLSWIIVLFVLALPIQIDRKLQLKSVMDEICKSSSQKKSTYQSKSNKLGTSKGLLNLFLRLEYISIRRNKNIRKLFLSGMVVVLLFCILCSFTNIYANSYSRVFWCIYSFVIIGCMILSRLMCYEGNYIDILMVRKESILTLLKAKYYFYSILLFFPFLLMLLPVIKGQWPFGMVLSCMIFTMGFQYCLIFQTAVYNKYTIPLNEKLISSNGIEKNYYQIIINFAAMLIPPAIIILLSHIFNEETAFWIISAIGLAGIATHNIWLKNIYQRLMKRKYKNIEGFRTSRG